MNYGDPCLSNHATNVVENHGAKNLVLLLESLYFHEL